jgi:hypothetical protein
MSRNTKTRIVCLVLLLGALASLEVGAIGPFRPPPDPPGGTGSCPPNCTYCCQELCGCPVFEGCIVEFSCTCSSIQCTQSCDYHC